MTPQQRREEKEETKKQKERERKKNGEPPWNAQPKHNDRLFFLALESEENRLNERK